MGREILRDTMDFSNWLLVRGGIYFWNIVELNTCNKVTSNRTGVLMIRLVILIILILFVIWILRPFLKTKRSSKTKDTVNRILNSGQSNFRRPNSVSIIITATVFIALAFWLLPKLGINFLSLLQKIIPIASSLRGILPF